MKEDFCPKCGKEINLALPHAYDRELQRPVHRECQAPRLVVCDHAGQKGCLKRCQHREKHEVETLLCESAPCVAIGKTTVKCEEVDHG